MICAVAHPVELVSSQQHPQRIHLNTITPSGPSLFDDDDDLDILQLMQRSSGSIPAAALNLGLQAESQNRQPDPESEERVNQAGGVSGEDVVRGSMDDDQSHTQVFTYQRTSSESELPSAEDTASPLYLVPPATEAVAEDTALVSHSTSPDTALLDSQLETADHPPENLEFGSGVLTGMPEALIGNPIAERPSPTAPATATCGNAEGILSSVSGDLVVAQPILDSPLDYATLNAPLQSADSCPVPEYDKCSALDRAGSPPDIAAEHSQLRDAVPWVDRSPRHVDLEDFAGKNVEEPAVAVPTASAVHEREARRQLFSGGDFGESPFSEEGSSVAPPDVPSAPISAPHDSPADTKEVAHLSGAEEIDGAGDYIPASPGSELSDLESLPDSDDDLNSFPADMAAALALADFNSAAGIISPNSTIDPSEGDNVPVTFDADEGIQGPAVDEVDGLQLSSDELSELGGLSGSASGLDDDADELDWSSAPEAVPTDSREPQFSHPSVLPSTQATAAYLEPRPGEGAGERGAVVEGHPGVSSVAIEGLGTDPTHSGLLLPHEPEAEMHTATLVEPAWDESLRTAEAGEAELLAGVDILIPRECCFAEP